MSGCRFFKIGGFAPRHWSAGLLAVLLLTSSSLVSAADEIPIYDSEPDTTTPRLEPEAAAKAFKVPDGFQVSVFAAEPDVQNPIGLSWDSKGRLWIAENYTYAELGKRFDFALRDRILIFTDEDGDGRHDKRQVFTDDLQALTSVEVGTDGIWVMAPPRLLFIPDRNHDDIPDGPAITVLDGFDIPAENFHNFANGLRFGPDGWLYGRCGGSSPGRVGQPGTPDEQRIPLNGGIWRYHPQRKVYEVVSHGTTNPWGHDWNSLGELFFINTVNGHLWQMIPGAHFVRPFTIEPHPRCYQHIDQHADHWHWDISQNWTDSRGAKGKHGDLGGGHAHIGATIYLGDNWPAKYRDQLMTLNLHGQRVNVEQLDPHGSGYVGRHTPDILFSSDLWFRGLDLTYGPDGGVYILDWSDTGECHEHNGVHRRSGRIYKVTNGTPKPVTGLDLKTWSDARLLEAHKHTNEWFTRQARLELVRRHQANIETSAVTSGLRQQLASEESLVNRLRALWSLWNLQALSEAELINLLKAPEPEIRLWALRLLTDHSIIDTVASKPRAQADALSEHVRAAILDLAKSEPAPMVRLGLASTLQRLPVDQRAGLAASLVTHAEDAGDHNIPSVIWYGLSPVTDHDPGQLASLMEICQIPLLRQNMARALAESLDKPSRAVEQILASAVQAGPDAQRDVILGLAIGLEGWQKAHKPEGWARFEAAASMSSDKVVKQRLKELNALFGDGRAVAELRKLALNTQADMNLRVSALQSLIQQKDPELRSICETLLRERFLNTHAIPALAMFDDPKLGDSLAQNYYRFHYTERPAVLDALSSRASFVPALLARLESGEIPRTALTATQARQIVSLNKPELTERLTKAWGEIRGSSEQVQAEIAKLRQELTPEVLASADMGKGRVVFNKACASCHRLHGFGQTIGPDLTGSGRQNLDYLLINILAPAEIVPVDYRLSVLALTDGRVINGIKISETPRTITLQTANTRPTIERTDIEEMTSSNLSLMPDGLLKTLTAEEVRDLIAYLQHPTQSPLPKGVENVIGPAVETSAAP